ncbi:antitoxin [Gordonia sp. SID5947]|uniref:antitoxin n=1 Tax=Gordonia sp. SID5947 TaxID=2690315 RepID=UPI00136D1B28|nr:antitoxin [Gordonia sp. SID5947]MYR06564.1 antitoxin [Gordonia sp. SID5947]
MDLKGLVDKAKAALKGNPSLIEKGGDTVNKVTGGKYAGHVDKAQDAVKKAVGADTPNPQNPPPAPKPDQPNVVPPKPEEPKQNPPQG